MIDDPLKCKLTTKKNVENKNVLNNEHWPFFFMICIDELSHCFVGLSENQNCAHGCQLETK